MNTGKSNYKNKTGKTLSQVLNEMNPDRPSRTTKYGLPYEEKIKKHDSSQDIEQMEEFDKRQPTGIFNFNPNPPISLKNPGKEQTEQTESQQTESESISRDLTPRFSDSAYNSPDITPNRHIPAPGSTATARTDIEASPGVLILPNESNSPTAVRRLTYKDSRTKHNPDYGLPSQSENALERSPSFNDLPLDAQNILKTSVESLNTDKDNSDSDEGNTQREDDDMDFGGKKKGKKGKKTKRAKKVKKTKKARKTKKKRSNKK